MNSFWSVGIIADIVSERRNQKTLKEV